MPKKILFLAIIPFFMFSFGDSLFSIITKARAGVILEDQKQSPSTSSAECRYCPVSGSREREDLEEQMQEVFKELRKLEKMFKKKMNQDVLPRIQEEIKRLKEWLEKYERKENKPPPQWTNLGPSISDPA